MRQCASARSYAPVRVRTTTIVHVMAHAYPPLLGRKATLEPMARPVRSSWRRARMEVAPAVGYEQISVAFE